MASDDWVHVGGDGTGKHRMYVGRNAVTGQVRASVTAHVLLWDAEDAARLAELLQRAAMPGQPPAVDAAEFGRLAAEVEALTAEGSGDG